MSQDSEIHDYEPKPSVRATGSVKREKDEPATGLEPLSLWLFAACAGVLIVGGSYLGAKSVGFDLDKTGSDIQAAERPDIPLVSAEVTPLEKYLAGGKNTYVTCQGCHLANGAGLGQIPPLVNSEWPAKGTERFAQIILKGLHGPIKVAGTSYGQGVMPAQGALSDLEIAQVMTYVRHKFNGVTDMVVTDEMVADARARFGDRAADYTAPELSGADVMLPGEQPAWMSEDADAEAAEGGEQPAEGGDTAAEANAADAAPAN